MTRKQHNGLLVSGQQGREVPPGALLPLLCAATIFALARLTGMPEPWLPALAGAIICSMESVPGLRKWYRSAALAAAVLSLLILRDRLLDGFCQWYNGAAAVYTAGSGVVIPALAASGSILNLHLYSCWTGAVLGLGLMFVSLAGMEAVCACVTALCGGAAFALGRMIDPLPLLLSAAMLCTGRGWKHRVLPVGLLTAAALLSLLPGAAGWAGEQSEAVRRAAHIHRYETKYTTLPEGQIGPMVRSDAPALIVTMEKPEVLYLRGFTGAGIEGGRWVPLDTRTIAEEQDLLYWLNSREFDPKAQFEAAASGLETRENTVTVQNVGACSAYRYIPFTICADEGLVPENLTQTAEGDRYDSFTTVYGGAALLPELLGTLEAGESRYLRAEAAYRSFVSEHYLTVPEQMAQQLQPYWEKAEGQEAQQAVRAVLDACWPEGAGHDPYYATAAVLTLRHFGIPARYAEGYILPRSTATTVEVTGEQAACWAEVYHDGIGWIPMALTPGLDEETQQQEEQPLPPDTPVETQPPETQPASEPEPEGGYQVRVAQVILYSSVIVLLLLLLAAAVLVLRRRYILRKWQAIMYQEDIREAVTRSFADSVAVLARMNIHRGRGSLDVMRQPLEERFGKQVADSFEAASRLNARALFSSRPMTEAERQTVIDFRSTVLELLRQNTNRLQRFRMKYILCLF